MKRQTKRNNLPTLGRAYEELNRSKPRNVPEANLLGLNEPQAAEERRNVSRNLEGLFNAVSPFTKGIFLDNDIRHRLSVQMSCGHNMTVIAVPESASGKPAVPVASEEYVTFVEKMSSEGKDATKVLARMCLLAGNGVEALDTESGIGPEQVRQVREWVEANSVGPGHRLVAVFDFDRTLSIIEGGFFLGNSLYEMKTLIAHHFPKQHNIDTFLPGLTINGFAEYLAGGEERMAMLQAMFDDLYGHNVKVIVLTNNGGCMRARNLFRELTMVYTRGRPVEVICGVEFGYDKGLAVKGQPTDIGNVKALRDMCLSVGGYRRQTRKQKKKARKTRRR